MVVFTFLSFYISLCSQNVFMLKITTDSIKNLNLYKKKKEKKRKKKKNNHNSDKF